MVAVGPISLPGIIRQELTLIQVWRSRTAPYPARAYTALLRDTIQIR